MSFYRKLDLIFNENVIDNILRLTINFLFKK